MSLTAAQTVTAMGAEPTLTSTGPLIVHVALEFTGLAFVPANLLAALTTQYGAGKVASEKDTTSHNAYVFRITP